MPSVVERLGGEDLFSLGILFLDAGDCFFIEPGSCLINPITDVPSFLFGKFIGFLGWYFVVLDGAGGESLEAALLTLAGDQDFAGIFIPTKEEGFAAVHIEAALSLFPLFTFRSVAGKTPLREERVNFEREELLTCSGFRGRERCDPQ